MKNIRQWFNPEAADLDLNETEANLTFEKLLDCYKRGLLKYFNLEDSSLSELIQTLQSSHLKESDKHFLLWLEQKAAPSLESIVLENLTDNKMDAVLDYEHYILQPEVENFLYPDDVRACLIDTGNELIRLFCKQKRTIHLPMEFEFEEKESDYIVSKIEEPALKAGSKSF